MEKNIDKKEILNYIEKAIEIMGNAYVPYSKFRVGAILIDDKNNEVSGVNVENASYGLTNCAERTAIFTAVSKGMRKIKYLIVVADTEEPVSPCGACRQVISEFSDENTVIILGNLKKDYKIMSVEELLPYGFKLKNNN